MDTQAAARYAGLTTSARAPTTMTVPVLAAAEISWYVLIKLYACCWYFIYTIATRDRDEAVRLLPNLDYCCGAALGSLSVRVRLRMPFVRPSQSFGQLKYTHWQHQRGAYIW